ncbi:hypothetical protein PTI98_011464 [Pleurotus ostreatus]|nr:hypothetical protein PTI98_011464 [Pleurotus ostreatus]
MHATFMLLKDTLVDARILQSLSSSAPLTQPRLAECRLSSDEFRQFLYVRPTLARRILFEETTTVSGRSASDRRTSAPSLPRDTRMGDGTLQKSYPFPLLS